MIKKLDKLGRVLIPAPVREFLGIKKGDGLKIEVIDGKIVLSKIESKSE